jgi:hypothetical protein
MPRHRKEVAATVAAQLHATERAIDEALTATAGFVGFMPVARMNARLSAVVGQQALDRAMEALARLTEARRAMVEAHNALAEVHGQIGLGPVNFGALGEKPPYTPQLRVIDTAVA